MDFLIGGVPRSGTSIGGIIFNDHPEGFCYAAETHWIPFLADVAGVAPVPARNLSNLRRIFAAQNRLVLVEKVQKSVDRGGDRRMLVFEAGAIGALTDQAMALLEAGMFGAELCTHAARILREYVHSRVGRSVIGEKTPSNVFAFRDFGTLGARAAFIFMREPFAVIRSMQNRGGNRGDRTAGPFRSTLLELIGMYVQYMEAINLARTQPNATVVTYEELLSNSHAIIGSMFGAAGLPANQRALDVATKRVRLNTPGNAWEQFTPGERAMVLGLTEKTRRAGPYNQDFFNRLGLEAAGLGDPMAEGKYAVLPMYGVHAPAAGEGGRWLMRDSCFAIAHGPGARSVELSLRADFPGSVLAGGETATLTVRDHVRENVVASAEVRGTGRVRTTLRINLADLTPICAGRHGSFAMLQCKSSHAYRASVNSGTRVALRFLGRGHRLLSFKLTGFSFA